MLHRKDMLKPDGRALWLYGRDPVSVEGPAPSPGAEPVRVNTHARWHPLVGEWVVYAAHRQDRTFLPSAENNPLAPTIDAARPTELPTGTYDVAVFENRFPSLAMAPGDPPSVEGVEVRPANGQCEVVVFAQDAAQSLATMPADRIALILDVLGDRTTAMKALGCRYVLPFENRGAEMGVTLHHPHGQIYGYGFVPSQQARALSAMQSHKARHGTDLVGDLLAQEKRIGSRIVYAAYEAAAFVPPFARFPYEIWIVPERPVPWLAGLTDSERMAMASALSQAIRRLDALWGKPMPYLMTFQQAPTDGALYPEWRLHIQIWPIRRAAEKLKYLAGTELGAGVFASDVTPEDAAARLREVAL